MSAAAFLCLVLLILILVAILAGGVLAVQARQLAYADNAGLQFRAEA